MAAKYVEAPPGDFRIFCDCEGNEVRNLPKKKEHMYGIVFLGKESENRIEFLDGNGKFHIENA